MKVVHLATELAPIAKVGGLGDVTHGLSKALKEAGHDVTVILPKYSHINISSYKASFFPSCLSDKEGSKQDQFWTSQEEGVKIILIDSSKNHFNRGTIYGEWDDAERFLYFSLRALDYLKQTQEPIDVLHLHDWPTAIGAFLYKTFYQKDNFVIKKVVFTIHNLEHQGQIEINRFLNALPYKRPPSIESFLESNHQVVNLMKSGIIFSDAITTVSPSYAKEILTFEGGQGLDNLLRQNQYKLTGILNGIDRSIWNPEKDKYLSCRYDSKNVSEGKRANKYFLRKQLNLSLTGKPLICCISRLAYQKAPHLIKHTLIKGLEAGGQCILLGSGSDNEKASFEELKKEFKDNPNIHIYLALNEELAHQVFASADIFVVPSLFEPCGLTQLIALSYGSIPVVRRTGGLGDTVFDLDTSSMPLEERNGFTFDHPDEKGLEWGLLRAIRFHQSQPKNWIELQQRNMQKDYSWKNHLDQYVQIYKKE
ncbi:MAG: glycogen synthase [Rhabdochlamydiaceae bacterium]